MLIWFCFFVVVYFLIYKHNSTAVTTQKNIYYILFLLITIYFSAFRDGLGSDYTAYKFYCERDVIMAGSLLAQEPLAIAIEYFCYQTDFSAVIFFLITSVITCSLTTWIYTKYNNAYIALFFFLTYTNLYLSSLNLVRQFTAASLILFGAYYFILKKKSPMFFLFVFIAFLFHKSSAVFVLIYFLRTSNIKPITWTVIILASWFVSIQPIFNIPFIRDLLILSDYQSYLSYDVTSYSKFSLINLYMHVFVLMFIWYHKKLSNVENKEHFYFVLKMTAISIIFSNISANDLPFAYRYAIFCSVFIPILFTFLPNILDRKLIPIVIYVPLCIVIWTVFYNRRDDRVYCPQQILPIESVFDRYYKPYENSESTIFL